MRWKHTCTRTDHIIFLYDQKDLWSDIKLRNFLTPATLNKLFSKRASNNHVQCGEGEQVHNKHTTWWTSDSGQTCVCVVISQVSVCQRHQKLWCVSEAAPVMWHAKLASHWPTQRKTIDTHWRKENTRVLWEGRCSFLISTATQESIVSAGWTFTLIACHIYTDVNKWWSKPSQLSLSEKTYRHH